jgi:hypothetical protein
MSPDGAQNQECPCWQRPAPNYDTRPEQNWELSSTDILERLPVIGGHYQAASMRGYEGWEDLEVL